MPEIKHTPKRKEYWYLEYSELDNIIRKELGLKWYEFLADDDDHRNNIHVAFHGVEGKLSKYEKTDVARAMAENKHQQYITRKLLNHLVARNFLPAGDYLIEVFW